MKKEVRNIFRDGPINPTFIAESIAKHQSKTSIGAHDIFLGQVRADEIDGKEVASIDFSAYQEMANAQAHEIKEAAFHQFDLTCLHIYHSLGTVLSGQLCLFVFVSAPHRKATFEAIEYLVNEIKAKLPIFGKEHFENNTHQWKVNK